MTGQNHMKIIFYLNKDELEGGFVFSMSSLIVSRGTAGLVPVSLSLFIIHLPFYLLYFMFKWISRLVVIAK